MKFGKYKGQKVKDIIFQNYSYFLFLDANTNIKISDEVLKECKKYKSMFPKKSYVKNMFEYEEYDDSYDLEYDDCEQIFDVHVMMPH